jgi:hypothetical protein
MSQRERRPKRPWRPVRRLLCALTWHSWVPLLVDGRVLCECSFCGQTRWIPIDNFDSMR